MAYQVRTERMAFQPVDPDDPTVPTGPEEIVERGGIVPDYVAPYIVSALLNSGVIVAVADRPDPTLVPVKDEPASPALNPEQPPPPGTFPLTPSGSDDDAEADAPVTEKPSARDSKAAWESYAVGVGVPQAEAESMTKVELIAEVERRESSE